MGLPGLFVSNGFGDLGGSDVSDAASSVGSTFVPSDEGLADESCSSCASSRTSADLSVRDAADQRADADGDIAASIHWDCFQDFVSRAIWFWNAALAIQRCERPCGWDLFTDFTTGCDWVFNSRTEAWRWGGVRVRDIVRIHDVWARHIHFAWSLRALTC